MTATRRRAKEGKYNSMNKDSPSGSPYETLAEHDQSKTKRDTSSLRPLDVLLVILPRNLILVIKLGSTSNISMVLVRHYFDTSYLGNIGLISVNLYPEFADEQHTGIILTSEVCVSVRRSGDLANGRRDV
jgi:hypothetical protein